MVVIFTVVINTVKGQKWWLNFRLYTAEILCEFSRQKDPIFSLSIITKYSITLRLAAWKDNNQVIYLPSYAVSIRIITLSTQSIKYLIQMYYYQNATKTFKLEEKSSEIEYTTMKFCVMIDCAPVGNSNSSWTINSKDLIGWLNLN